MFGENAVKGGNSLDGDYFLAQEGGYKFYKQQKNFETDITIYSAVQCIIKQTEKSVPVLNA